MEIYAEGENGISGAFVNGEHDEYVLLTSEIGEWKIEAWGDSVNFQKNPL